MPSKFRKTTIVAITAILNNLLLSLYGLVFNRLIIVGYGSSIAGLISTLLQFASLFTVIEGGFSFSVIVAAYKPIIDNNYDELNTILYTAKRYFIKISTVYVGLVLISGTVYIFYLNSPLSFLHTLLLLFITTTSTALTIGGLTKYTVVLSGNNVQYIASIISAICKTITWLISIVLIIHNVSIIIVYSLNVLTVLLNILTLRLYEKKKYPYISYKGEYNLNKIKGVKDMMFQKIASTVFTSTDLVLVSIGLSLSKANVYYIYNQIFLGVYQYLSSLCSAPTDSFGHLINSGEVDSAKEKFVIFKKTVNVLSTIFFTATTVMITSFLIIYTRDVEDENYIIPGLAILFFSYNYIKINNSPYGMLINVSGHFKKQNIQTGIATVTNIVLSILLMQTIGLNGIILGSTIGTFIIISVNLFKANEIFRFDVKKDIFLLMFNYLLGSSIVFLSRTYFAFVISDYLIWFVTAVISTLIISVVIITLNYLIDKSDSKKCLCFYYEKFGSRRKNS